MNRGTFYFHYSDVYDLLHKIEDAFFDQFNAVLNDETLSDEDAYPYLRRIFTFLGENQDLCRILLGENGDIQFMERLIRLVVEKCSYFWRGYAGAGDTGRLELYNAFLINGCIGILKKWLDDGLSETPEELSELVGKIVVSSVEICTR